MTTRSYEEPAGREISIARTAAHPPEVFQKNGTWALVDQGKYPPTTEDTDCFTPKSNGGSDVGPVGTCAAECLSADTCRFFWVYTTGSKEGLCCSLSVSLSPVLVWHRAAGSCAGAPFILCVCLLAARCPQASAA